jgi:hypothetical protein
MEMKMVPKYPYQVRQRPFLPPSVSQEGAILRQFSVCVIVLLDNTMFTVNLNPRSLLKGKPLCKYGKQQNNKSLDTGTYDYCTSS